MNIKHIILALAVIVLGMGALEWLDADTEKRIAARDAQTTQEARYANR